MNMGFREYFLPWEAVGEEARQQNLDLAIVLCKVIKVSSFKNPQY